MDILFKMDIMRIDTKKHLGLIIFSTLSLSSMILTKAISINNRYNSLQSPNINIDKKNKKHEIVLADKNSDDYINKKWINIVSDVKGDIEENQDIELEVINELDETIICCYVDPDGKLHHYYPISDGSIKDGSVSSRHIEFTCAKDSFVFIKQPKVNLKPYANLSSELQYLSPQPINGNSHIKKKVPTPLYNRLPKSPFTRIPRNPQTPKTLEKKKNDLYFDSKSKLEEKSESLIEDDCLPKYLSEVSDDMFLCVYKPYLCGHQHTLTLTKDNEMNVKAIVYYNKMEKEEIIDNTDKVYEFRKISGFQIFAEPGVFEEFKDLHNVLEQELKMVRALLPTAIEKKLRDDTPLWINKSMTFGSSKNPTLGRGSTYHPKNGQKWLKANGMTEKKAGSIEMYTVKEHFKSRNLWGIGGILLHEFCHAYHDKICPDGFDCDMIRKAYNIAMTKKLYDSVAVHGIQGKDGPIKAYACANAMEFFAELSVAYLWHSDFQGIIISINNYY